MSVNGENQNKPAKLSSNHFLTANKKLWEDLWVRAKTEINLKSQLKIKVV